MRVAEAEREGMCPLVLGGDHSIALGTLGGMASVHGPGGVIWLDAHGDLNTPETTPSGNVHGMPLAAALGQGGPRLRRATPGRSPASTRATSRCSACRSLDDGERELDPRARPGRLHDERDRPARASRRSFATRSTSCRGAAFVHVSLDLDVVDPEVAPGVGTPVRGGLSYREAHLAMELVAEAGILDSLEIVEVNPILDRENRRRGSPSSWLRARSASAIL